MERLVMRAIGRFLLAGLSALIATSALAAQDDLVPNTSATGPALTFDWPALQIGVGTTSKAPPV
jgi:hypothetical protein